jgi:23S rRNA (guanosine2251-2'-O)-methyltransferase
MKPPHSRPGHRAGGAGPRGEPPQRPAAAAGQGGARQGAEQPRRLHQGPPRDNQQRFNPDHQRQRFEGRPHPSGPRPEERQRQDFRRPEGQRAAEAPPGTVWLYGLHAVAAALANPARRLRRLLVSEEAEPALLARIKQPWPVAPERVEKSRLEQLLGRDIVHQGVALLADRLVPPPLTTVLERRGPIIVLDQVSDPRNVGAILRSAQAFGAAAVVVQERNGPEETGALAKAASGALETMPVLRAVNIARTLVALKAAGLWVVGSDGSGKPLDGAVLRGRRVALVLGNEGEGLRRLVRETCDEVAAIAMPGAGGGLDSLNVAAAAAIALYELCRAG